MTTVKNADTSSTDRESSYTSRKRRIRRRTSAPHVNDRTTHGENTHGRPDTEPRKSDGTRRKATNHSPNKKNRQQRRTNAQRTQKNRANTTRRTQRTNSKKSSAPHTSPRVSRPHKTSHETSAGGMVIAGMYEAVREDESVDMSQIYIALIGRLDRRGRLLWSMPKGHVENDEGLWETAEREVWEETGLDAEVFADLGSIEYWFIMDGKRIHKVVHHHLLRYVDGVFNDCDPEVTEVAWVPLTDLVSRLSYTDERRLARKAHSIIKEQAVKDYRAGRLTPL